MHVYQIVPYNDNICVFNRRPIPTYYHTMMYHTNIQASRIARITNNSVLQMFWLDINEMISFQERLVKQDTTIGAATNRNTWSSVATMGN